MIHSTDERFKCERRNGKREQLKVFKQKNEQTDSTLLSTNKNLYKKKSLNWKCHKQCFTPDTFWFVRFAGLMLVGKVEIFSKNEAHKLTKMQFIKSACQVFIIKIKDWWRIEIDFVKTNIFTILRFLDRYRTKKSQNCCSRIFFFKAQKPQERKKWNEKQFLRVWNKFLA